MSLLDAAWAIREAIKVSAEIDDMITAGAVGEVLQETMQHAVELLDIADEELVDDDRARHTVLAAAAPMLRARLQVQRDRMALGAQHCWACASNPKAP